MTWQPGEEPGSGEEQPDPAYGVPAGPARDPRLAGFAPGGEWDTADPSAALALMLQAVAGPQSQYPGAEHDELLGVTRRWAALESWAAAEKLASLRALIRDDDQPLPGGGYHDDLPDGWSRSLTHAVALALAMPPTSAEHLLLTAWTLQVRLPGIGRLLADGTLTLAKAKAVEDALFPLTDSDAAKAEAMILPYLAGKTYGQIDKLAQQAAITVDPGSAARRREDAERNRATVVMRRSPTGAVNLSGYDLPTADALAAHAQVCTRALEYKESGEFPDVLIDQLRAMAYVDILNGITAADRIAAGQPAEGLGAPFNAGDPTAHDSTGDDAPDDPDDPGGPPPPPSPPKPPAPPSPEPPAPQPKLSDLVIPLSTLLGLTWRPGDSHGLGPLDPDLCRTIAATAANDPRSTLCITVTDEHGYAIGHGCGRLVRTADHTAPAHSPPIALAALPGRVNLTITSALLNHLTGQAQPPPGTPAWSFTHVGDPGPPRDVGPPDHPGSPDDPGPPPGHGPPDIRGTWQLTLPDGRTLTVRLEPVPTFTCDHARESHAYQPNDTLRHLVQIRDRQCTFPTCSRHARESDFEHAIPYDQGGRTCACNAGARSRQCHQVKQSPGWDVTQPQPGWHRWATPSGRAYTQEPNRYPF